MAEGGASNFYVAYQVCGTPDTEARVYSSRSYDPHRAAREQTTTPHAFHASLRIHVVGWSQRSGHARGHERSGQRAAIVNETHRSHQMLTFDWRPSGPGSAETGRGRVLCTATRRSRHLVCAAT